MKKAITFIVMTSTLFFTSFSVRCDTHNLHKGLQYRKISHQIKGVPDVIEFFSFYYPPYGAFSVRYKVSQAIDKILPKGQTIVKYHVSSKGAMGPDLTQAWAVAQALGVQFLVEEPIFNALQIDHRITSPSDIRQVFIESGVSGVAYDNAMNSPSVHALAIKQNLAAKAFNINEVPSFYVKGQYKIRNNAIGPTTIADYGNAFAQVVSVLLAL